jgi:RecG-like helicase
MATKKLKKKSRSKKRDALPDAEQPVVIRTHALLQETCDAKNRQNDSHS